MPDVLPKGSLRVLIGKCVRVRLTRQLADYPIPPTLSDYHVYTHSVHHVSSSNLRRLCFTIRMDATCKVVTANDSPTTFLQDLESPVRGAHWTAEMGTVQTRTGARRIADPSATRQTAHSCTPMHERTRS
eukprot:scaffold2807_cov336-Prasinococcus_capsulatus_cf.AAC.3